MTPDLFTILAAVGFLVAIMMLARACADEGLFDTWAEAVARSSTHSPSRRLGLGGLLAAIVTAALTLHATVMLLAPALLVASRGARRATSLAMVRIANTGSTLLPVSNITNLLAFGATGLAFVQFAWLMLPVWVVGVVAELAIVRWWFRRDLTDGPVPEVAEAPAVPMFPAAMMVVVVLGLATGADVWLPAAAGAIILGVYAVVRRTTTWRDLIESANLQLAGLVLLWAIVVAWLSGTRAADGIEDIVPTGDGLVGLLLTALVAMAAANMVSNMPATIILLPAAAAVGPVNVLALLIGVNIGANLTAIGSLANLLWHQVGPGDVTSWRTFHAVGLVTTPLVVVLCTAVLWGWTSLVR